MKPVEQKRFGPIRRAFQWLAFRALSYAGIPMRDPAVAQLFGYRGITTSGVYVDESNANTFSAYYRGVSLIACSIAMLRFECVRVNNSEGTVYDPRHLSNAFFAKQPNPNMSWFQFAEMLGTYAITWGNGCAWIERDKNGFPIALWPLPPDQITIGLDDYGNKLFFFKAKHKGEKNETYEDKDIFHLTGYGFDGVQGCSVVKCARDSIGLGISTERFGAGFFGNNAVPGFVIEHPAEVSLPAKNNIVDDINEVAGGTGRARKGVVLDEGMKYKQIGVPPEDGQFLQTRQFQVREIARWLGVPPHMLYDLDNANFSTTENQGLDFLIYTLSPWLQRWMQEMKRKLLTDAERETHDFRADTSNLVMMDTKTKWDVYGSKRNMGYYTLNDIAKDEKAAKLTPEVGDVRITPSTMIPLVAADKPKPIEPQVINDTIALLRTMGVPDKNTAVELFKATIPDADVMFVNTMVNQLVTMGVCKA